MRKMKRKPATIRLRSIILTTSVRCFCLLILIVCLLLFMSYEEARRSSQDYVTSLAASINESLGLIDANLKTVGRYLSVYAPLSSLYRSPSHQSSTMQSIFDMVDLTVTYSNVIQDMAVVSPNGTVRSFFSNLAIEYIDIMIEEDLYDFSDTALSDYDYFFFPAHETAHDSMFVFLLPLISTDVQTPHAKRVATVVLACRMSTLESLVNINLPYPYSCALLDANGQPVVSSASEGYQPSAADLHAQLASSVMPLTISLSTRGRTELLIKPIVPISLGMLLLFLMFTTFYFSRVLRRSLAQPVERLVRVMPSITLPHNHLLVPHTHVEELDVIVDSVNLMVEQLDAATRNTVKMELELMETQLRKKEAELYALQSQINPHFLFNTLQCIRSLAILHHAEDISTISSALSAILRYSIREMQQVSVREEMNIIRQYLKIMDIRYQNRFSHEIDVPEALLDYACPCMIIQPLVENAIIHGVSASDHNGAIRICGRVCESTIHFEVADNGAGISGEKLRELQTHLNLQLFDILKDKEPYGKSFGLFNIQRRIRLQYGDEYGLSITSDGGWTRLYLRIPAVPFEKAPPR